MFPMIFFFFASLPFISKSLQNEKGIVKLKLNILFVVIFMKGGRPGSDGFVAFHIPNHPRNIDPLEMFFGPDWPDVSVEVRAYPH